jgi:hypothetical protein
VTLAQRLLELHRALDAAGLPHAFGGAIALAYWTEEPRGTRDLDVNVFVPTSRAADVLDALPRAVRHEDRDAAALKRDGQVRVWWDDTPVDLFLDYAPIHAEAARRTRSVPFEGAEIPVLGPLELGVFKAMFDRTRDWADIEAMLTAGTLAPDDLRRALRPMIGASDDRLRRIDEAERRSAAAG